MTNSYSLYDIHKSDCAFPKNSWKVTLIITYIRLVMIPVWYICTKHLYKYIFLTFSYVPNTFAVLFLPSASLIF